MEMRPYELSLCTAGDFLLIGIIYVLDVADGISATKGWGIEDIVIGWRALWSTPIEGRM